MDGNRSIVVQAIADLPPDASFIQLATVVTKKAAFSASLANSQQTLMAAPTLPVAARPLVGAVPPVTLLCASPLPPAEARPTPLLPWSAWVSLRERTGSRIVRLL